MADLKTTNIFGDAYINNKVGIATNAPATRLQIGQLSPTAATEGLQFGDDTGARLHRINTGHIRSTGGFSSATFIIADNYLQTNNNLIYPASQTATQRLEVGNASGNAWVTGISIAQGGNVTVYNNLTVSNAATVTNDLTVNGNTYLGNANNDTVYVNDTIRIGATDSGDASLFFGEGAVAGSDYGARWYWDSGYTFTWYTRNNGTDTALFDYVTNDLNYINWRRHFHMQNKEINYNAQVHFNAGTRFVGNNTSYLNFRSDSAGAGGILVQDGNATTKGYTGYWDSAGGGILNNTGNWAVRYNFGNANSGGTLYGAWTVNGNISASNLSGTNTGDQTIGNGTITIAAGTGIGVGTTNTFTMNQSGATTVTVTNSGVTSNVAGTGISVSGATGAVTITNSSPNATHTGDVTGATALTIANDAVTTVKILNANVTNAKLANSSLTIGSTAISLGATATTIAGLTSVTSTTFVGALTGNATTATALTSMNISQFTNNSGYLTSAVTSLAGTTNRITVSGATGAVTLNLPQDIHTGASPTFAGLSLTSVSTTGATITNLTGAYQNTTVYDSPRTQSATPSRGIRAPASSIQFTDSYAIAPFYTYRSTGDWPVPYGIGWGTGGESSGIFQRYASNGYSFGDMIFYTGNDGSGAFSFRRHTWEGTTYFAAGSGELNTELFRIDWAGKATATSFALPGGFTITDPGSGYAAFSNWVLLGTTGFYSSTNSAHLLPNPGTYGSWKITGTRGGWHGIEFDSGVSLMANSNQVGFHRNGYGWQMWWSAGTGYVHKGDPGGGTQATILDSSNQAYAWAMNQNVTTTSSPTFSELTLSGQGMGAYNLMKYSGIRSGNWQTFTTTEGQLNVIQVNDIAGGAHTNYPTGVYTYGAVMSWRTNSHSFQLYAAHTGDLAYKTQWGNDNYSGWRRILDSTNYIHAANMNQYVRTTDNVTFANTTTTVLSATTRIQTGNYTTIPINGLGAAGTQSRTFEIARIGIDYNDWNNIGTFEVELHEQYYARGLKKVYNIWYGYVSNSGIRLVEWRGNGDNNFQCRIGTQVLVTGDQYYLPVFVDVRNYGYVDVVIKTNRTITTNSNPPIGSTYVNTAPSATNIVDFTADSDLEISTLGSAKLGGNTILTTATTSATGLSIGGNAATATTLQTGRAINGVSFNGSAAITVNGLNYNVNNDWLRENGDDDQFKLYGNSRTMIYRTDGNTNAHGGGAYAHIFYYGGSADANRMFIINTDGRLWSNYHGWLDAMSISGNAATATSADNIDGRPFVNTNSNSATNADTINSNGISYYTSGVTNFSGNATDGALFSQAYSNDWQHQIAGDYRSGQIALRGKNSGTWQSWRRVLDQTNASYAWNMNQNVRTTDTVSFAAVTATTFTGALSGNATSATSATSATFLNSSNYINRCGSSGNANTDFQNTPAGSVRHNGDDANLTNSPGGTWWFYDNYRHSNSSNYWGTQIAWGWEDNANRLATRNITGNSFGGWVYYLNSANYNSYSPTLTGTGASGTWAINITGNAATATTATNVTIANGSVTLAKIENITAYTILGNSNASSAATPAALSVATVATMLSGQTMNINGSSTSCSGNAATATLATKASTLSQGGGTGTGMTFNWSGQSGQPTWLWGSNDGTNIYVWNPSNFNVNYATSAGSATNATTAGGLAVQSGTNYDANKIVRTDGNGYILAGWINTISGNNGTTAIDRVYASNDGYIRYYTPANFRTVLDVPTRNGSGVTNFGINTAPSNRLHVNGDGTNPAIRVDNGAIDTTTTSGNRSFFGWLPISIGGNTRWIRLFN